MKKFKLFNFADGKKEIKVGDTVYFKTTSRHWRDDGNGLQKIKVVKLGRTLVHFGDNAAAVEFNGNFHQNSAWRRTLIYSSVEAKLKYEKLLPFYKVLATKLNNFSYTHPEQLFNEFKTQDAIAIANLLGVDVSKYQLE